MVCRNQLKPQGDPPGLKVVCCPLQPCSPALQLASGDQPRRAVEILCSANACSANAVFGLFLCSAKADNRLCCAVLCCAVLCCAVLCCAVLYCAVLCCTVLYCAVLCCTV